VHLRRVIKPGATDAVDSDPTVSCAPVSGATFPVGTTTVSCTAKDATGNTTAGTLKVNVAYAWSNFLQPINVSGTQSVFKLGSTVPVKFNLTGPSARITDGTFYIKYFRTGSGDGAGEAEAFSTAASTTGQPVPLRRHGRPVHPQLGHEERQPGGQLRYWGLHRLCRHEPAE
jgi:hypothetical protein